MNPHQVKNITSTNTLFKWKVIVIGVIGLVIISPNLFVNVQSDTNVLIKQATSKINSYKNVAIEGTARTSMWKSAFPWIKDHPIIGSGLDTIRFYYPKYRRPEYGKLEGGHNYTPDRLHNEYLNTLATKGAIGFITHYALLIAGSFIILCGFINKHKSPKISYWINDGWVGVSGASDV